MRISNEENKTSFFSWLARKISRIKNYERTPRKKKVICASLLEVFFFRWLISFHQRSLCKLRAPLTSVTNFSTNMISFYFNYKSRLRDFLALRRGQATGGVYMLCGLPTLSKSRTRLEDLLQEWKLPVRVNIRYKSETVLQNISFFLECTFF